jgi:hypothetical protein
MSAPAQLGSERLPGPLDRFAALTRGGAVLMMTARFGRSPVRDAAYHLRTRHRELDLTLSWRLFTGLDDWGKRWPVEQGAFAAGLILSAAGDPVIERAVGRCLYDLAGLGRPLLWGVSSRGRLRWQPRFMVNPNGWTPDVVLPYPDAYARLRAAHDTAEFHPQFDPILFSADPDFLICSSRLRWTEERHFNWAAPNG